MDPPARMPNLHDYEPVLRSPKAGEGFTSRQIQEDSELLIREKRTRTDLPKQVEEAEKDRVPGSPLPESSKQAASTQAVPWLLRRGHTLSYAGLFLFTIVLFFRPYELVPALSSFKSMAFWTAIITLAIFLPSQLVVEGNLTARPREVNLLLLLCVTGLLAIPTAINPLEAWETFTDPFLKAVIIFVVFVNVVRTQLRLKALFLLVITVSLWLSISALIDYRAGNLAVQGVRILGAIGGLFENPNDLALHLATIIPIAVALFLSTRNPLMKVVYVLGAGIMTAAVVVTFSRGGFLGLLATGLVLSWKLGRKNRFTILIALLVAAVFILLLPAGYSGRVASIFSHDLDPFGSATAREELFYRSLWTAIRNPVFGIGMGNFHIVSIKEQVSHNAYTQVAAEMGIAACVLYVMFIVTPIRRLRSIERETMGERSLARFYYLSIGLQASLISYMVSSFFGSIAYLWYVYYLVGYAVCMRRIYEDQLVRKKDSEDPVRKDYALEIPAKTGQVTGNLKVQ